MRNIGFLLSYGMGTRSYWKLKDHCHLHTQSDGKFWEEVLGALSQEATGLPETSVQTKTAEWS